MPAFLPVKGTAYFGELGTGIGTVRGVDKKVISGKKTAGTRNSLSHVAVYGKFKMSRRILLKSCNSHALLHNATSVVRLNHALYNFKQSGFAGTVSAHNGNAILLFYGKTGVIKKRGITVRKINIV